MAEVAHEQPDYCPCCGDPAESMDVEIEEVPENPNPPTPTEFDGDGPPVQTLDLVTAEVNRVEPCGHLYSIERLGGA